MSIEIDKPTITNYEITNNKKYLGQTTSFGRRYALTTKYRETNKITYTSNFSRL